MFDRITRLGLFAMYQSTLALGILLLPVALLARRVGVTIPIGRLVEHAGRVYESAS